MSSGSASGFATESKGISGTFCAAAGKAATNIVAIRNGIRRFIKILLSCARCLRGAGRLSQDEFLHAPGFDFPDADLVRITAIHHVDNLESAEFLARMTELTDDRAVQFHLVDLTRDFP